MRRHGFDIFKIAERRLSRPGEADQVTLGVCEVGDHKVSPRVFFRAHPTGPTEALGLLERSLDFGNPDVKDHVTIVAQTTADPARDSGPVASGVSVHEPVVSGLGDRLRHRGVSIELPPEEFAVVAPEFLRILPDDLEMHNRLSCRVSFRIFCFHDGFELNNCSSSLIRRKSRASSGHSLPISQFTGAFRGF
jgi:hypothetical protein